ncbi:hypothetical protein CHLRE_16g694207v5 [Chlamydomonas reinhardtii]|uniref:F-box domain-containing protein n=1 Tax=Chlamydomonas reinhardtii TaxID=3055 RepID=A0A2K3CSF9_CHLRE|nr:uncharacterized protein CHLRE_16g694207v5 [Chlamydomonas reinhardtii]PNW71191.1 hypothetical protein CHLRE_16g694207v5 [Chlamydomonas reinhardtii]
MAGPIVHVQSPPGAVASSSIFPQLPPELTDRIGAFVPPNDMACAFRCTCRAARDLFSAPRFTTLHLSQPGIPHDVFARKWAAPGACHSLSYRQRRQLTTLTAASGDVANLHAALAAAGLVPGAAELGAAAGAGRLHVCAWLRRRHNCCTADPTGDALVAAAAAGAAEGAAWLLSKGGACWSWAAVGAAAAAGHVALMDWLVAARPTAAAAAGPVAAAEARLAGGPHPCEPEPLRMSRALAAVAEGCGLGVLRRCCAAWPALWAEGGGAGGDDGGGGSGCAAAGTGYGGDGDGTSMQRAQRMQRLTAAADFATATTAHTGPGQGLEPGSGEAAVAAGGGQRAKRDAALVTRGHAALAAAAAEASVQRWRGHLLAAAARSGTADWQDKVTWLLGWAPDAPGLEEAGRMAFAGAAEARACGQGGGASTSSGGGDGGGGGGGDGGEEAACRMAWLAAQGLVPAESALLAAVRCRAAAAVDFLLAAPPAVSVGSGAAAAAVGEPAAAWPPLAVGEELVVAAAEVGDVGLLRRLLSEPRCEAVDALDALCAAAGGRHLAVLEFLTGPPERQQEGQGEAQEQDQEEGQEQAGSGEEVGEEERQENGEGEGEEGEGAAGSGRARRVRRRDQLRRAGLQLCGAALDDPLIANEAAERGSLEVLRWLAARRCPMDEFTLAAAAEGGCGAALEWLAGPRRVRLGASGDAWRQASWGDLATLRTLARLRVPLGPAGAGPAGAAATFLNMLVRAAAPLPVLRLMVEEARCPVDWEKARRGALRRRDESRRPLLDWVRQQAVAAAGLEGLGVGGAEGWKEKAVSAPGPPGRKILLHRHAEQDGDGDGGGGGEAL